MPTPTPRLLAIALLGLAVIGFTGSVATALDLALLWLAAVVVLGTVDAALAPVAGLSWTREHEPKLSLGVWNSVTLTARNESRYPATLRVRDAVPAYLIPRGYAAAGTCSAAGQWSIPYQVFPLHRGDHAFGPVTARCRGPLGLAWRQQRYHISGDVKVYPNLLAIKSYEGLLRRGQLEEIGLRSSRRWGSGTEFERLREYNADDEFRRINWTATARRHTPIVMEYETERSQSIMLALDAGRLMSVELPMASETQPLNGRVELSLDPTGESVRWPDGRAAKPDRNGSDIRSPALTRLDYAVNAMLLLAFVSQQRGDRVGLLTFSDRVTRYVAPRPGRRGFLTVVEALYNLEAESCEADFAGALEYLAVHHRRRSLVVLATDLMDPEAISTLVSSLAYLARRHLALIVTLRDPVIERLAAERPADSRSVYQRAVARTLLDEREETLTRLRRQGVLTLDVPANALTPALINRYLEIKARASL